MVLQGKQDHETTLVTAAVVHHMLVSLLPPFALMVLRTPE